MAKAWIVIDDNKVLEVLVRYNKKTGFRSGNSVPKLSTRKKNQHDSGNYIAIFCRRILSLCYGIIKKSMNKSR